MIEKKIYQSPMYLVVQINTQDICSASDLSDPVGDDRDWNLPIV